MSDVIIQIIGFVGVAFFMLSFQMKSNNKLFMMQMIGCALLALQFSLLGAITGSGSLIINMIRNAVLLKYNDWKWVRSKVTLAVFVIALAVNSALTWAGPASLLPFIGVSAGSIAFWTNDPKKIRLLQVTLNCPCCLIYNLLSGSWAGVINESFTLVSVLVSIIRFGWKNLGDTSSVAISWTTKSNKSMK